MTGLMSLLLASGMIFFFTFWTVLLIRVYLPSTPASAWSTAWHNWKRHGIFSSSLTANYTGQILFSKFRDQG